MRKNIFYVLFLALLWACSGEKTAENSTTSGADSLAPAPMLEKGIVKGEKEEIATNSGKTDEKDDSFIRCKANGQDMEFRFVGTDNLAPNHLERKPEMNYSRLIFERGSTEQMTERVMLTIINYDPAKLTLPYKVPRTEQGKLIQLVYQVKIAGIYIQYSNQADYDLEITSYKDGVVEGKFSGTVTNTAGKAVVIENGTFKIKVTETQLPA